MVTSHHPPALGGVGCRMLTQVLVPQILMALLTAFLLPSHSCFASIPELPVFLSTSLAVWQKCWSNMKYKNSQHSKSLGALGWTRQSQPHTSFLLLWCPLLKYPPAWLLSLWAGTGASAKCHMLPPLCLDIFPFLPYLNKKSRVWLFTSCPFCSGT